MRKRGNRTERFQKTEIFSGSGRRTDENFYDTDWIDADIYITDYINKLELSEKTEMSEE